jgi:arylsulfatase A-like enzyme
MLTSPAAMKIFDLSQEKPAVHERYGYSRFGQSCILARRLVEKGTPFVQVNWSDHVEPEEDAGDGGWDNHYRHFQLTQDRQAPSLDQTLSGLLTDLSERGLLEKTLVVAVGEFGRSPKINPNAGRDHWEHCYSALLAGGGVSGGRVIGSSDARGEKPADHPVTPADLAATIYQAVGITSEQAQTLGLNITGTVIDSLF